MDERHLDSLLEQSAGAVPYPPFVSVRPRVLAALAVDRDISPAPRWRAAAFAAAVVVAAVALVALAAPSGRTAVADFFGVFQGQRIEVIEPTPAAAQTSTPAPSPAAPAAASATPPSPGVVVPPPPTPTPVPPLAVTLEEASEALGFEPGLPSVEQAGAIEAAYVVDYGGQRLLIVQYEHFDLWQSRGYGFFGKGVSPEATLEEFEVNGSPAVWLVSAGHQTAFFDQYRREILGSRRTVDRNALIWLGDETYYRMETELPLEDALAIARGLP